MLTELFRDACGNESEILIETPDKIKVVYDRGNYKRFQIVNGGKYSEDSEMNLNGEMVSMRKLGKLLSKPDMPIYVEEILPKERVEYLKKNPDELNKLLMEDGFWSNIFPILLSNPLNKDVKYEYVGKAESDNQRADIVDVKSNFYRKIRLFFDEKTHLLLMMTKTLDRANSAFTEKYYFSDYQLTDGLLVAKNVKTENEEVFKDGSAKKTYGPFQTFIKEVKISSNLKITASAF